LPRSSNSKKAVSALEGDALLDMWIEQEYQPKLTQLETQKELYLEIELAGKFGITMWRKAVATRREALRKADRNRATGSPDV
jgi:hypothetical protein